MSEFIKMLSHRKGDGCDYRPDVAQSVLVSPPHCDDENGYVYLPMTLCWKDETFAMFKKDGCWPEVYKWEHIRSKPDENTQPSRTTQPVDEANNG